MLRKLFSLLICLLAASFAFAGASNFPEDAPFRLDTVPGECNWPPPLNFHVEDAGPTWVKLEWNPVMPGVVKHRVKTYNDANVLISNIVVPAAQNSVVVNTGAYNPQFRSTINAICTDGTDSKDIVTVGFPAGVISDLIVTGVTTNNSSIGCTLNYETAVCDFPITTDNVPTYFQIRPVGDASNGRKFKTYKFPSTGTNTLRAGVNQPIPPQVGDYFFRADRKAPNSQTGLAGNFFQVFRSAVPPAKPTLIAVFDMYISLDDSNQPVGQIRLDTLIGNYEIVKLILPPPGQFKSGPSTLQEEADDRNESPKDPLNISVSPNPFSETLDVTLGENRQVPIHLQLLNLSGQIVIDRREMLGLDQITLPTEHLSPGFYMLRIEADGEVQTLKVIKSE